MSKNIVFWPIFMVVALLLFSNILVTKKFALWHLKRQGYPIVKIISVERKIFRLTKITAETSSGKINIFFLGIGFRWEKPRDRLPDNSSLHGPVSFHCYWGFFYNCLFLFFILNIWTK